VIDAPWQVPSGWTWQKFDDVATVASNLVGPAEFPGLPHVAPNHIESGSGRLLPTKTVADDGVTSSKHRFYEGQILYSKIRPYLAKVVVAPFEGLCSADMYPIETVMDTRFLKWWMLTPEFTRRAAGHQARTVLPKINKKALGQLPIPVPPPDEQRVVADLIEDYLSQLDAAKSNLLTAARRLTTYEAAALTQCREGEPRRLADFAEIQGGIQKQPSRTPAANAFPFLRVANVTARGLNLDEVHQIELFPGELDRYRLLTNDLLVVEGNGSPAQIGRAALWDGSIEDCVHQNHLIRVRAIPGLEASYLEAVWNSPATRAQLTRLASSSSGLHTLSVSKLKSLVIPVPNTDRQQVIVERLNGLRQSRRRLATAVDAAQQKAEALRRCTLHAAFRGELTVQTSSQARIRELASV
jgi:type I restriction enzyme, S subunit